MGGFITDYSSARPWGAASSAGGDGGHSVSLSFRIWVTAYASGASAVIAEAGGVILFFENVSASDGVLNLSPMGEAAQNFSAFVAGQPERATPYVPFALVMEHAHVSRSSSTVTATVDGRLSHGAFDGLTTSHSSARRSQGFGISTANPSNPVSWGRFPLSPSELVGWTLLEELWPTGFNLDGVEGRCQPHLLSGPPTNKTLAMNGNTRADVINAHCIGGAGNYLVPAPCGDTWDVLAEPNFTRSLGGYRMVALGGELQLGQQQLAELSQWVRDGGVALAFASQLRAVDGHAEFVGMGLGDRTLSVRIGNVTDEETHWSSQAADHHSNQRPFCVSQGGTSAAAFYIKTGGNSAVTSGWDNGVNDKCCTSAPNACRWYPTLQACTAALMTATCLPCASCNGTGSALACPQWKECGASQTSALAATTGSMGASTSVLMSAGVTLTNNDSQILPAILRNKIGAGSVLTVLLEDADALRNGPGPRTGARGYGVFSHLLGRMADSVLPFDLLDVTTGTIDMKTQLQMLLGRSKAGWHVTLINNRGVTKHPSTAAVIDATKAVSAVLKLKAGYGALESATLATDSARRQLPVIDEGVRVTVPPGGVVVVELGLKQSGGQDSQATQLATAILAPFPRGWHSGTTSAVTNEPAATAVLESPLAKPRPGRPYAGGSPALTIHSARNEVESFLVVVNGGAKGLTGVTIDIPAEPVAGAAIALYAAHYVNITKPSGCSNGPTGLCPDALVPAVDVYVGETRNAFPMAVPAGENRVAWADIFVPAGTAAGKTAHTITVRDGSGATIASLQLSLHVFAFELPTTPTLNSLFGHGADWSMVEAEHKTQHSAETAKIVKFYLQCGLMNRVSFADFLGYGGANMTADAAGGNESFASFVSEWGPFVEGTAELPYGPSPGQLSSVQAPHQICSLGWNKHTKLFSNCTASQKDAQVEFWSNLTANFAAMGWDKLLFDYTVDEPECSSNDGRWAVLEERAAMVRKADPRLRTLVTASADKARTHNATSLIDLYVPIINDLFPKMRRASASPGPPTPPTSCSPSCKGVSSEGSERSQYDFVKPGNLWTYQSCMSYGCGPNSTCALINGSACELGWPSYAIDHSGVRNRAMEWASYSTQVDGELYYSVTVNSKIRGGDDCWEVSPCIHTGSGAEQ